MPLAKVVSEISRLAAEHGTRPVEAELVGLAPEWRWRAIPTNRRSGASTRARRDRERLGLGQIVAQTRKKRRRKRRGTQGGRIDRRPARGGAKRAEARAQAQSRTRSAIRERRIPELEQLAEAGIASVLFFALLAIMGQPPLSSALIAILVVRLLRPDGPPAGSVPLPAPSAQGGREAPQARAAADQAAAASGRGTTRLKMDVRMFTVGQIAENCFLFRRRLRPGDRDRPRGRSRAARGGDRRARRDGRGDPPHPPTSSMARSLHRTRTARPSGAPRSRRRCSRRHQLVRALAGVRAVRELRRPTTR